MADIPLDEHIPAQGTLPSEWLSKVQTQATKGRPGVKYIEHKRIKKMSLKNKIWFTITWPIFDIIGKYTMYVAIFKKVEWKQIPHESKITIDDIRGAKND